MREATGGIGLRWDFGILVLVLLFLAGIEGIEAGSSSSGDSFSMGDGG